MGGHGLLLFTDAYTGTAVFSIERRQTKAKASLTNNNVVNSMAPWCQPLPSASSLHVTYMRMQRLWSCSQSQACQVLYCCRIFLSLRSSVAFIALSPSALLVALYKAQIPLGWSRLDTTRLETFDVSSPCILAVSSLSNSTARNTRHDERDRRDSQLSLLCNLYKVMTCKLFTNCLEYTFI